MAGKKSKAAAAPRYIGPDYDHFIILPGMPRKTDPRAWSPNEVRRYCEQYKDISRYFDFELDADPIAEMDPDEDS